MVDKSKQDFYHHTHHLFFRRMAKTYSLSNIYLDMLPDFLDKHEPNNHYKLFQLCVGHVLVDYHHEEFYLI
eukprot:TRINITY_DN10040_c0_g1_i1.p1 TRINITY_DN10040_c0_g1~~TRINITY_DN10040_c0_g1_i1.p1  ORF type:complete len:71 (+),score=1.86 TRINITY_DN10040_c0_g1_i1:100-312(+)